MAISIWNERAKSFKNAKTVAEATHSVVNWIEYIVDNLNGGKNTTGTEDFDALWERWRFADVYDELAIVFPRLSEFVDSLFDYALDACQIFEGELTYREWLEREGGYPDNLEDEDEIRQEFWTEYVDLLKIVREWTNTL